jgi:hypothetical protein
MRGEVVMTEEGEIVGVRIQEAGHGGVAEGSPPRGGSPPASGSPKGLLPVERAPVKAGATPGVTFGGLLTYGVNVAVITMVVAGQGSAREKAKALVFGYAVSKGSTYVASQVVGLELGGIIGAVITTVISMPNDQGQAYNEAMARGQAEAEAMEQIDARAQAIYNKALAVGDHPEWTFVYEQAIHERYVELGLDKQQAAYELSRKKMLGDPDPNVCSKYGPPGSFINPKVSWPNNNAPSMNAP